MFRSMLLVFLLVVSSQGFTADRKIADPAAKRLQGLLRTLGHSEPIMRVGLDDAHSLELTSSAPFKLIDENESHVDHIERRILRAIFDSDMEPFNKLLVKEYVIQLGEISDLVEKVSRRVYILSAKRRV